MRWDPTKKAWTTETRVTSNIGGCIKSLLVHEFLFLKHFPKFEERLNISFSWEREREREREISPRGMMAFPQKGSKGCWSQSQQKAKCCANWASLSGYDGIVIESPPCRVWNWIELNQLIDQIEIISFAKRDSWCQCENKLESWLFLDLPLKWPPTSLFSKREAKEINRQTNVWALCPFCNTATLCDSWQHQQ